MSSARAGAKRQGQLPGTATAARRGAGTSLIFVTPALCNCPKSNHKAELRSVREHLAPFAVACTKCSWLALLARPRRKLKKADTP